MIPNIFYSNLHQKYILGIDMMLKIDNPVDFKSDLYDIVIGYQCNNLGNYGYEHGSLDFKPVKQLDTWVADQVNDIVRKPMGEFDNNIPHIENIVSTANMQCRLDLNYISYNSVNVKYDQRKFAAMIMRIRDPKTTILVFESGQIVCTGAKTVEDSERAIRCVEKKIRDLGCNVQMSRFKIENIVTSCYIGFNVNLIKLQKSDSDNIEYNSEIFPGLTYKFMDTNIKSLVFTSGKIVLTGGKSIFEIMECFRKLMPLLKRNEA
jgi:TATA-box binding protein (TBP) (component of TFIID and TFIIIB)